MHIESGKNHIALIVLEETAVRQRNRCAIARAYAVSGDKRESLKFLELAKKAGEEIKNDKDRDNFFAELNSGDWNGVK